MSPNQGAPIAPARGRWRPLQTVLLAAGLAVALALQWLTAPLPSPLEPPLEAWQAASLSSASPAITWAAPVAGTPRMQGLPPHAWLTQLLPPPASRTGPDAWRLLATVLVGIFVVLMTLALRAGGCHPLAAVAAAVMLPCAGVFRGDPFTSVESALAAALVSGCFLAALTYRRSGGPASAALAMALLCLAVDARLSFLALALPAWALLDASRSGGRERRTLLGLLVVGLLVACAHSLVAATLTLAAAPVSPGRPFPSMADVLRLAALGPVSGGAVGLARDQITALARAGYAVFGLLGLLLALPGLSRILGRRGGVGVAAVLSGAGLFLIAAVADPAIASPPVLALLLGGCACLALGADRLLRSASSPARVAAALVLLPPVLAATTFSPAESWAAARSLALTRSALVSAVAPRAAFVADLVPIDRAMLALPGISRVPRDPSAVRRFAAEGYEVYAFDRAQRELEARGLAVTAVPLTCESLDAFLSALPRGSVVAVAASADAPAALQYSPAGSASSIGAPIKVGAWMRRALCLVGVAGASGGALVASETESASLRVPADRAVSNLRQVMPASIELSADTAAARVASAGQWFVEARQGVAIAVLDGLGNLAASRVVDDTTAFTLAPPDGRLAAARVEPGSTACMDLEDGVAADITPLGRSAAIGWSLDRAPGGSLVAYAFADTGLAVGAGEDDGRVRAEAFAGDDPGLAARMKADGVSLPGAASRPGARIELPLTAAGGWGKVTFGAVPDLVVVRTHGTSGRPVRVCAAGIGPEVLFADARQRRVDLGAGRNGDPRFGAGWYGRESDAGYVFRWTAERAVLLLRLARVDALRVSIDGAAAVAGPPVTELTLVVNGRVIGSRPLPRGGTTCEWDVGDGVWVEGVNQVELRVSRAEPPGTDPRVLGAMVRSVRLERAPRTGSAGSVSP